MLMSLHRRLEMILQAHFRMRVGQLRVQSVYLIKWPRQNFSFNFNRDDGFKDKGPSILLLWHEAKKNAFVADEFRKLN